MAGAMQDVSTGPGPAGSREPAAMGTSAAERHMALLLAGLRRAVDRARPRPSCRELSLALGRERRYVDSALRGEVKLRVEEVLRLLALVGADSRELFYFLFPLGGELERRLVATLEPGPGGDGGDPDEASVLDLRLVRSYLRREHPPRTPERGAERARRVLRQRVRRSGAGLIRLSERLFGGPNILRFALSGHTALSFQQIFAVLEALEEEPGRYFLDVLGPEDGELAAGITWQSLLDRLVPLDQAGVRGFADLRPERGIHPPAEMEANGEEEKPSEAGTE